MAFLIRDQASHQRVAPEILADRVLAAVYGMVGDSGFEPLTPGV
jgi:hypothetical protein